MIEKTASIMRLRGEAVGSKRIRFDDAYDDIDASKVLDLSREYVSLLGNPTEITVIIQPGDKLNEDGWGSLAEMSWES